MQLQQTAMDAERAAKKQFVFPHAFTAAKATPFRRQQRCHAALQCASIPVRVQNLNAPAGLIDEEIVDDSILGTTRCCLPRSERKCVVWRQIEAQERARLAGEEQKTELHQLQQELQPAKPKSFGVHRASESAKQLFSIRLSRSGSARQQQQSKRKDARKQRRYILMSNIKANAGVPRFAKSTASARGKSRKLQSIIRVSVQSERR
ncbi:MAG: hypothetical protein MHM6MM_004192 [Cercozoa sp. M6MM]